MERAIPSRRAGFSTRGMLLILTPVAALPVVAWLLASEVNWSAEETGPLMHVVQRNDFVHEITERGDIESASNVEIRCEVESRGQGGTTILWIIPEGTYVQPGDKLVSLDSSSLDDELRQQQIVCNNSNAAKIQAENTLETAKIALKEYLEGVFKLAENEIIRKRFVASEAKRQAEQTLEYSKGLARKGYVTDLRVETDKIAVDKAQLDYESAELELKVLRDFTKFKMIMQLESDIKTAEAKLDSEKASHEIDVNKLELVQKQVANCTISAKEPGQVVYANETDRRGGSEIIIEEGATIREHQAIIRLPDPKRMQVKAKINEAKIALVKPGMPVTIRMDAFTDAKLEGVVERVNEYPAPSAWWGGSIKEYETFIKILGSPTNLKPGLTAEVRIQVQRLPGVLQVPVQAVFEHGGKNYCVLRDGAGWRAQEVDVGSTNDKFVVINKGLEEGQAVVLGAFAYRDQVDLPEVKETPRAKRGPDTRPAAGTAAPGTPAPGTPAPDAKKSSGDDDAKKGRSKRSPDAMFTQMDKNGNGTIEKDELPQQMQSFFSEIDTDKNGTLSRGEMTAAMARLRASGRGGPGGPGG
ncbi:MAG: HlyD family efflux transporter periplasmic adaptor subunit, partial [Planctomycetia bacterium]|nr:HlyD family efflux transporter periplasmic adaptor subunit [Planctomycetia bacterium]